jgi:hypothetical protein
VGDQASTAGALEQDHGASGGQSGANDDGRH